MSIIEYLPVVLAGAGIALRFWMSRDVARTESATITRPLASANSTRMASKTDAQRAELALA